MKTWVAVLLFVALQFNSRAGILTPPDDSISAPKIAVLLPLYLDSLFKTAGTYSFGNSIPKYALPALEYYNGLQLAADSLRQEGIKATIEVVDSRNPEAVRKLLSTLPIPSLIIGLVQNGPELRSLADISASYNIPFINVQYPNDYNITERPNMIMVNSTLRTHCLALYQYLQRNHATDRLLLINRTDPSDQIAKRLLLDAQNNTPALKLKWKQPDLSDSFNVADLLPFLDSNTTNTALVASLNGEFGQRVIKAFSSLGPSYKCNVFGMPTWDDFPLTRPEFKGVNVFFTTPFITNAGNLNVFNSINAKFKKTANSRPSDMVFKGFELTYKMVKTIALYPEDFKTHLNDKQSRIFADFKFEPVIINKGSLLPDYYENKKVYFIKKLDGVVKSTN